MGSWTIKNRPEGDKQGPAYRVSFISVELDGKLAGPPTSLLRPGPCTTLMNFPITARETATQGARASPALPAGEGLHSLLSPGQPKWLQLLPHHI